MNNQVLVTIPSRNIRETARSYLSGYWKKSVLALFIFYAILRIPVICYETLIVKKPMDTGEVLDIADRSFDFDMMMGPVSSVYTFIMTAVFTLGIAMFFLSLVRGVKVNVSDVFDGFEYFFKALGLFFMVSLFVVLWSLLFIVPGIIAALRYSQAFFILSDNPEMNIMDCINESKKRMMGNKTKFFCLGLSFIGWSILAGLPTGIVSGSLSYMQTTDPFLFAIIFFLAFIPTLWVETYMTASYAVFYEILLGKPMVNIEVDPEFVVMD